jgi:hypothetical protein
MEDEMNQWIKAQLCDVANLILGVNLFFSPWIFGFAAGPQSQSAFASGIVIVVLSVGALSVYAVWEEWVNLIVGCGPSSLPGCLGFKRPQP